MIDIKQFISAIDQIAEEKGVARDEVEEIIEMALAAAYKKDYGERGQNIKVKLDSKKGEASFLQSFLVVSEDMLLTEEEIEKLETERQKIRQEKDKEEKKKSEDAAPKRGEPHPDETGREKDKTSVLKTRAPDQGLVKDQEEEELEDEESKKIRFNPKRHIMLAEAKKKDKNISIGEELLVPLQTEEDFGRIAAQTAKQVIIQRIREAERNAIYETFKEKEDDIVSGSVQRIERGVVYLDIGRTAGVLFPDEQIPSERYRQGQRVRVYVMRVEKDPRGPVIVFSRRHPRIVAKLFELEVPEIDSGVVEIKAIAREAGSRSKVAVSSNEESIDPVGSCVGHKGIRVSAVINELGGENIDIIAWDETPEMFIANSLSPAKVLNVELDEKTHTATVDVKDDQLSLAIGRKGQNVRLAAKLTGWKIDVRGSEKLLAGEGVLEKDHKVVVAEAAQSGNSADRKEPEAPTSKSRGPERGVEKDKKDAPVEETKIKEKKGSGGKKEKVEKEKKDKKAEVN